MGHTQASGITIRTQDYKSLDTVQGFGISNASMGSGWEKDHSAPVANKFSRDGRDGDLKKLCVNYDVHQLFLSFLDLYKSLEYIDCL